MATKRAVGGRKKQGLDQSALVKAKLRRVLRKEFGEINIMDKSPKPASYELKYEIDNFTFLLIEISITPVTTAPVLRMTVEPGKIKL